MFGLGDIVVPSSDCPSRDNPPSASITAVEMRQYCTFVFLLAFRAFDCSNLDGADGNVPVINANFEYAAQSGQTFAGGARAQFLQSMIEKDLQALHEFITLANQHVDTIQQARSSSLGFLALKRSSDVARPTINVHMVEPRNGITNAELTRSLLELEDAEMASREKQVETMASIWKQIQTLQ